MRSRQIIRFLFLVSGIAILALLFMPVVHVPCVVVHGPSSALRAQRAALLLQLLLQTAAFLLFEGLRPSLVGKPAVTGLLSAHIRSLVPLDIGCALRC